MTNYEKNIDKTAEIMTDDECSKRVREFLEKTAVNPYTPMSSNINVELSPEFKKFLLEKSNKIFGEGSKNEQ